MFRLLTLTAALGWLSVPPLLLRLRRGLRGTSLSAAWFALAFAWLAWAAAGAATLFGDLPAGTVDVAWYFVAVVMLLPPIAVLGARRPIHRVWPWFVLLPLLLIFTWPVLSAVSPGKLPVTWNIEEPMLVGYALVLVMGAGNYIGLRYTLPALLWVAALVLLIGSLCPATSAVLPAAAACRTAATLLLTLAAWIAVLRAKRRGTQPPPVHEGIEGRRGNIRNDALLNPPPVHGGIEGGPPVPSALVSWQFDQVWLDFRDTFGIVWSRRVQERFNADMLQRRTPLYLGIDGLESTSADSPITPADLRTAETALRWLLQKFVDPEWINMRMSFDKPAGVREAPTVTPRP